MPSNTSWFNARAARARLREIDAEVVRLQQEQRLLRSLLGSSSASAAEPTDRGAGPRPRRRRSKGPTLAGLIVEVMSGGPRGKGWPVGELVAALNEAHPGRLPAGSKASGLVSATLAQDRRGKTQLFVSRKGAGKRSKLYGLAG